MTVGYVAIRVFSGYTDNSLRQPKSLSANLACLYYWTLLDVQSQPRDNLLRVFVLSLAFFPRLCSGSFPGSAQALLRLIPRAGSAQAHAQPLFGSFPGSAQAHSQASICSQTLLSITICINAIMHAYWLTGNEYYGYIHVHIHVYLSGAGLWVLLA